MSETSRHHYVSNSATSRKKDALPHIESSDRLCKYSCAWKIYLYIYIPRVSSEPIHFLQKNK